MSRPTLCTDDAPTIGQSLLLGPSVTYIGPHDEAPTYAALTSPHIGLDQTTEIDAGYCYAMYADTKYPDESADKVLEHLNRRATREALTTRFDMCPTLAIIPLAPPGAKLPDGSIADGKKPATNAPWTEIKYVSPGQGKRGGKVETRVYREALRKEFKLGDQNYGFVTGRRNGCTVIDIDTHHAGMRFFRIFCELYGPPRTYGVRTGSGGVHLYFAYEPDLRTASHTCKYQGQDVGIDVRNDNGYVVGEYSIHRNGNVYECLDTSLGESLPFAHCVAAGFPRMPDWLKRMATPDSVINYAGHGIFDIVSPGEPTSIDAAGQYANVTADRLAKLITFCQPDIAYTTFGWRTGLRAINKIRAEYKISDIKNIPDLFARMATRGSATTYSGEATARESVATRVRGGDPGLTWFIRAARKYQAQPDGGHSLELEALIDEMRTTVAAAHYEMIAEAYAAGKPVDAIEDIMMGCIHQVGKGIKPGWVFKRRAGTTDISQDLPFTGALADYWYTELQARALMAPAADGKEHTPKDCAAYAKANSAYAVLDRLRRRARFLATNVWDSTDDLFTFKREAVARAAGSGRVLDTFGGFASMISPDVQKFMEADDKKSIVTHGVKSWQMMRPIGTPLPEVKLPAEASGELLPEHAALLAECRSKTGVQLWLDLLRTELCSGNEALYAHAVRFYAQLVQRPRVITGSVLVLTGGQGIGKGIFTDVFNNFVVGSTHADQIKDVDAATGTFNGKMHRRVMLVFDEAKTFTGAAGQMDRLKSLTGSSKVTVRKMYSDEFTAVNYARYVFITNNDMPVRIDADDRRYCVLTGVSGANRKPPVYGKLWEYAVLQHPTYGKVIGQDIVDYLATVDISGWDHTAIPETPERLRMKEFSLSPVLRFMCDVARREVESIEELQRPTKDGDGLNITQQDLYRRYCDYTARKTKDACMELKLIGPELAKIGLQLVSTTDHTGARGKCYIIRFGALQKALASHIRAPAEFFARTKDEIVPGTEMDELPDISVERIIERLQGMNPDPATRLAVARLLGMM